jgi:hypothetical protein
MLFRPTRVVTVTTPEEFDSAFASADRVIVEGDDALLSYAATKAAGDASSDVRVELGRETVAVGAPRRRGWVLPVLAAAVVVQGLLGAGIYFIQPRTEAAAPRPHHLHHEADAPREMAPAVETGAEEPSQWAPFMWPAVSIVAILALFLIARQAIAGGRNVDISWKVTEKVSGRVVITKVRAPSRRQRAAV